MNVLVACEESQEVCKAFRALGHDAYSCDIQPCSGGHPEWHIQDDVLNYINGDNLPLNWKRCAPFPMFLTQDGKLHTMPKRWDLIIAHPPCTYLTNAGARWLWAGGRLNQDRYKKGLEGAAFFDCFLKAQCEKIAIENPTPASVFNLPKCTQVIQPYEFGHPYSKRTCLWLKGLPHLTPTEIVTEHVPFVSSGLYTKTHDSKYKGASRKGGAAKARSKTFPGIARAMAEQWGKCVDNFDIK